MMCNLSAIHEVERYLHEKANTFLYETGVLEADMRRVQTRTSYKWEYGVIGFGSLRTIIKQLAKDNKRAFIKVVPQFRWAGSLPHANSLPTDIVCQGYQLHAPANKKTGSFLTFLYLLNPKVVHRSTRTFFCNLGLEEWAKVKHALLTNDELRESLGLPRRD